METATLKLAELVTKTTYEDIPPEVVKEAKRRIADVIGIGLSGSTNDVAKNIEGFCVNKGGSGKATIWGSGAQTSPAYAALANGTMTFHLELDDVHRTSHTHPGVSVIPGALALCEEHGLSGKQLIESVVLGYDAVIRIGLAVSPSIYVDRVFLAPGTLGVMGAAAAAAKLLKLDTKATQGALGSATYLGPLAPFEAFRLGASAKDTIMGWANFVGLNVAEMTGFGFNGPETAIEGDFGYCKATSERYDLDRIYNGLGKNFEILNTGIKPYACCRQHHAAIDAVLELKEKYALKPQDIKSITNRTFVVASRGKQKKPTTVPEAKYSAPYIIAVVLNFGEAWREQFTLDLIKDPAILELASKVEVVADAELDALYDEKWPSIIEITTNDGQVLTARRDLPKGEPEYPVSDEDLKGKFMSLACDAVTQDRAGKILEMIYNLENIADIRNLTSLLKNNR
jgi:2-methylcitrate dehydratase PrpD